MPDPETRICGTEVEYGLVARERFLPKGPSQMARRAAKALGIYAIHQHLSNGARFYIDIGDHPEYSTPECDGIDEAVAHELAGEEVVQAALLQRLREVGPHTIHDARSPIKHLNKRNLDNRKIACGAHESYSIARGALGSDARAVKHALATHLATRSIMTGAGMYENDRWVVAQKIRKLNILEGTLAHGTNRPLIDTRDESLAGPKWQRVHVSCGDSNVSPWAIRMKLGTTSLLLRMLEQGIDLRYLYLDPKSVFKSALIVADDITLEKKLLRADGKTVTAAQTQEDLATKALELEDLPEEEQQVAHEWLRFSQDAQRHDIELLARRSDWAAKITGAASIQDKNPWNEPHAQNHDSDIRYASMLPNRGFGFRLRDKGFFEWYPDPEAVQTAQSTPPQNTRARLRGEFIRSVVRAQERHHGIKGAFADWVGLVVERTNGEKHSFKLRDPRAVPFRRLEEIIDTLNKEAV